MKAMDKAGIEYEKLIIDKEWSSTSLKVLASVANSYRASEYRPADVSEKPLFLLNFWSL